MAKNTFREPGNEFGVMPFWFINDVLDAGELRRQLADFAAHGVGGVVIHPRVGLPRELAWMSPELLDYYRVILDAARELGLRVLLYDEAMYPSGSSCGQVVAADPRHHCRCLAGIELVPGAEPQLGPDENLIAVADTVSHGRIAVIDRKADSVIRGLHYRGEGPEEDTPPAADLLNPEAVDSFLNLVYERFYREFESYFGDTIIGIFTDEPDLLGRCRESGVMPGTTGIITQVNRILGYDFTPYLASLWFDDEPDAFCHRQDYLAAVNARFEETWYARLYGWCERCHTALTGHPAQSDELGPLRYFHIPGQDTVWRRVLPDSPSALIGPDSTQAKCSASAMVHHQRRRNLNECCGAYGHEMTFAEMAWLSNWCLVRGVNLLVPHAFYYSVRGVRRDERPPDVGPHSAWWDCYRGYADSCRRLCWLNTDGEPVCRVAVLASARRAPWAAAKVCFEHQFDFHYLEERLLPAAASGGAIAVGGREYAVLIVEEVEDRQAMAVVGALEETGLVFHFAPGRESELAAYLNARVRRSFTLQPRIAALRVRETVKDGRRYLILFNEETAPAATRLAFPGYHRVRRHDPATGAEDEVELPLSLELAGYQIAVYSVSAE